MNDARPPLTAPNPADTDLDNCAREPIHVLGAIQPFGFLIAASQAWFVEHASDNLERFIGIAPAEAIGAPLASLLGEQAIHAIRGRLQILSDYDAVERIFGVPVRDGGPPFDIAVHRSGGLVVIEAEPHNPDDSLEPASAVRSMTTRLTAARDNDDFFSQAVRQVRALTGFDRVKLYRFAADGSGEVIAESRIPSVESFLGLHYPASDIPAQARALYERNWLRIITDVNGERSMVEPYLGADGAALDLSLSILRAVSPVHLEYLRNMGVTASLSISILKQGRLWGLFACHHYSPRHISYQRRTAAELFGQVFSLMLESRERQEEVEFEIKAGEVQDRLMMAMAQQAGGQPLVRFLDDICALIACDGIGLALDGQIELSRATPNEDQFRHLLDFLARQPVDGIYATDHLNAVYPAAAAFTEPVAGLLAIPVSRARNEYLVFFRKDAARTVAWAGQPAKDIEVGPLGPRLTPRKSFELWQEEVEGMSLPWRPIEVRFAESLRVAVLEVVVKLAAAAEEDRRLAHERQELLIAELNHRVRNILGLIKGLVQQSKAGAKSVDDFSATIGGRVEALARAHDQITTHNWGPGSLRALVRAEIAAYFNERAERVIMTGPEVLLGPEAFSTLALVIHELVTNSAKYGALCDSSGRIHVDCERDEAGRLVLDWREEGGPPVQAPKRRGFGTTIIERSIPYDLKGEAHVSFELSGLRARLVIPAQHVSDAPPSAADEAPAAALTAKARPKAPRRVLVVEDNMIIAMDMEAMLLNLGAREVETASCVADALSSAAAKRPDFAVLDVNLGPETSFPVADRLRELAIPFVFGTGYGEDATLPERFKGVTVLKKPYPLEALVGSFPAAGA